MTISCSSASACIASAVRLLWDVHYKAVASYGCSKLWALMPTSKPDDDDDEKLLLNGEAAQERDDSFMISPS